jgi:hypothetical protein
MNFTLSPEDFLFQKEVKEFLAKEVTPEVIEEHHRLKACLGPHARQLMRKLGARGWLTPTWPKEYGGLAKSNVQRLIVNDELGHLGSQSIFLGAATIGPCLLHHGTKEQKEEYLPQIARGEIEFALGYTEPEAGSDVASLEIKAVDNGDHFIVNGQKMFNTFCHCAEYHWLAARTSSEGHGRDGISLFIVDLASPGITLRPLWTMDGERTNEVFYDDVRVPKKNLVGEKNRGFYHMVTALNYERLFPTGYLHRMFNTIMEYVKTARRDGQPLSSDPLVRQRMAQLAIELEIVRLLSYQAAWMLDERILPTRESSTLKLFMSELMHRIAAVGHQTVRLYGQLGLDSELCELGGELNDFYFYGIRRTIAAGSSEIQRNIIAIRGLGLPH